ncbi:MAG: hypothetical protein EOO75_20760, partial [Myxococcales bacterium]
MTEARICSIRHALLFEGQLWLATYTSEVWAVDEVTGAKVGWQFVAPVRAMLRTTDGRLVAATAPDTGGTVTLWQQSGRGWGQVRSWPRQDEYGPVALAEGDGRVLLAEARRVHVVAPDGRSREVALTERIEGSRNTAAAFSGGRLYVAISEGEFGGGLWRIDLATGMNSRVSRGPTTAVVAEARRPGCVLASVGLDHMGSPVGAIERVCGRSREEVWQSPLRECDRTSPWRGPFCDTGSVAVWDVLPAPRGFWASTGEGILRREAGRPDRWWTSVEVERRGGLVQSRTIPGLRLVWSDREGAVSVGGGGALLLPTE